MSSPARPSAARIRTYGVRRPTGARYVLAGALDKVNDRLRYTTQLFDGASGHELWSAPYDDEGVDSEAPGPDIATRIYAARSRASRSKPLRRRAATLVGEGRGQPTTATIITCAARRSSCASRRKTMRRRSPFSRRASRSTQNEGALAGEARVVLPHEGRIPGQQRHARGHRTGVGRSANQPRPRP